MVLAEDKLSQLANSRVLVVGDSMLDRYWVGDAKRISPEAPVPVISVVEEESRLGGAANVAKNIASVGGQSVLLSIVGEDTAGKELEAMLHESDIKSCLQFDPNYKTTVKLRVIARNQQLVRADFETSPNESALAENLKTYQEAIKNVELVLVSDYAKGGTNNIAKMIKIAREAGVAVYIDPKGVDYSVYRGASLLTPNLSEFQQVAGKVDSLDDINTAAHQLLAELEIDACLVTLSERGMILCRRGVSPIHQPTRAREVFDVTGAGDTVIAMMALAKAANFDQESALALANHAAGVVVNKMGTAVASLSEIKKSIERG